MQATANPRWKMQVQALNDSDPRIAQWTPMVRGIAKRYWRQLGRFHGYDELVAMGMETLWKATLGYDAKDPSGAQFVTYARAALVHEFQKQVKYWHAYCRRDASRSVSLDEPGADGSPLRQFDSGVSSPEAQVLESEVKREIARAMTHLSPRERAVVSGRLLDDLSHQVLSGTLRVTRQRVQQIESGAIEKIRMRLRSRFGEQLPLSPRALRKLAGAEPST